MPINFLDSVNNSLTKLDNSIHSKIEGSLVDTFIHELQDYLDKIHSTSLLNTLPSNTILTFAKYDNNFAVCFDYNSKNIYYLPQKNIIGAKPIPGDALKVYSPGNFYVDYTAIFTEEDILQKSFQECSIAK